jgi:C-terminal processing protease CtpA/Prc
VATINGIDAHAVSAALLARVHGDTPAFRDALLSRRFWFYYWKVYGAPAAFEIGFAGEKAPRQIAGSTALPAVLADEESFERQFRLELLSNNTAVLTLNSFAWPDKAQFLTFTHDAFQEVRAARAKTLIIDVRANGGGNDEMWIEGVLPYLATKPYRWASRFRKRVVVADPARHEAVGDIVDGEVETWIPAQPDNPLRFRGRVYVLLGAATYSSAVVFSNVMQDFHFGTIAGRAGSVRAAQTGGTRRTTLPNSGLIVVAPRFVLTRPSGALQPALLTPDLVVRDLSQLLEVIAPH